MLADPYDVVVAAAPSSLPSAAEQSRCMYAVDILDDVSSRASASKTSDSHDGAVPPVVDGVRVFILKSNAAWLEKQLSFAKKNACQHKVTPKVCQPREDTGGLLPDPATSYGATVQPHPHPRAHSARWTAVHVHISFTPTSASSSAVSSGPTAVEEASHDNLRRNRSCCCGRTDSGDVGNSKPLNTQVVIKGIKRTHAPPPMKVLSQVHVSM